MGRRGSYCPAQGIEVKTAAWQSANGGTGNLGTALCALRRRARRLNRPQRAQQYHMAVGGGDLGGRFDSQGRNTRGGTIAQFNLGMMLTVEGDSSGHDFGYLLHTKSCGTWILPRLRKKLGNKHDVVMAVCGVLLTLKGNSEKKAGEQEDLGVLCVRPGRDLIIGRWIVQDHVMVVIWT